MRAWLITAAALAEADGLKEGLEREGWEVQTDQFTDCCFPISSMYDHDLIVFRTTEAEAAIHIEMFLFSGVTAPMVVLTDDPSCPRKGRQVASNGFVYTLPRDCSTRELLERCSLIPEKIPELQKAVG